MGAAAGSGNGRPGLSTVARLQVLDRVTLSFRRGEIDMKFWHALCAGAVAQEDPEAVYAKLHRAMLAGNTDELLRYGTAAQQAELAKLPKE